MPKKKPRKPRLKMYIILKDNIPAKMAPLVAAHTAMGTYRKFQDDQLTQEWFAILDFPKVLCKASSKQFEYAKRCGHQWHAQTEKQLLHFGEIGLGIKVSEHYHPFLKSLELWRP